MNQDNSLLRDALESADLNSELDPEEFWEKPLGKNAKSKGVRDQYARDSIDAPVNTKVIFYESMSGARMGDNPYGIFEYLRAHPEHGEFLHVWSVDARGSIAPEYENASDVIFVRRNTRSYTYFLASAGYVVCNANLPVFYTRRERQKYLNTWHGVPYKSLGRNTPKARFGSPVGNATFTKATHILTPGKFTTDKIISAYSMRGVSNAVIAEIGYPRVDRTLNADEAQKTHLRESLGLETHGSPGTYRPTVLYAPTWRSENDKDVVDTDQLIDDLKAMSGPNIQLLYRGHHRMDRLIKDASVGDQIGNIIIPPHDISSNDLLSVVDVLITDFSSIFFDFLPTGRPIIHYLYDVENYARTRGVNLSVDELPGNVAISRNELLEAIGSVAAEVTQLGPDFDFSSRPLQGSQYQAAKERFCPHDDGYASKRAVNFLFEDSTEGVQLRNSHGKRPTAAFWAGDLRPGPRATNFLQSLMQSAASPLEQTVLIVERNASIGKESMAQIKSFGDDISTYSYEAESPVVLSDEAAAFNDFSNQYYVDFETTQSQLAKSPSLRKIFSREYRRRLDDAKFDNVYLAADLPNEELALAYFASSGTVTTADKWKALSTHVSTSKERATAYVLPYGTRRRKLISRSYRWLRKRAGFGQRS
ncbi:CDP-glycerol glycerophosphotransferase family protein [Brevibacterium sp. UCMA 11752]|uniref:CDP-glycerol glycerophosphotransferase family protein n=1 Tax=Brevibacterium sp. UCMA 11752 TaxID=2745946 RepID=UPI001F2628C8|nr:CDP-glycerol glycerophosphotransferase family protein [Brevibacterium sp. UCMA 11752]MCF2587203.1 CDP-glycerol glycerophosphotransferase family protein [Brevibacterium sp. UCMA 11752]